MDPNFVIIVFADVLGPQIAWQAAGTMLIMKLHIDGLGQDYCNSIANTLELLQCCIKPST